MSDELRYRKSYDLESGSPTENRSRKERKRQVREMSRQAAAERQSGMTGSVVMTMAIGVGMSFYSFRTRVRSQRKKKKKKKKKKQSL